MLKYFKRNLEVLLLHWPYEIELEREGCSESCCSEESISGQRAVG